MKLIFSKEKPIFVTLVCVIFIIIFADLFFHYVINSEVDATVQTIASLIFVVIIYYFCKGIYNIWTSNKFFNFKNKKHD
jgi:hypothetical protein